MVSVQGKRVGMVYSVMGSKAYSLDTQNPPPLDARNTNGRSFERRTCSEWPVAHGTRNGSLAGHDGENPSN